MVGPIKRAVNDGVQSFECDILGSNLVVSAMVSEARASKYPIAIAGRISR